MLTPEQRREVLEQYSIKDAQKQHLAAIAKLPSALREVPYYLLGYDKHGKSPEKRNPYYVYDREVEILNYQTLEACTPEQRIQVFGTIFPTIAPYIEQTWQFMKRLPYPTGYSRKSFRAPDHPEATLDQRFSWLRRIYTMTFQFQQEIEWFAAYCNYLGYYTQDFGPLFAAVIEEGGEAGKAVFDILVASAKGEHEVGMMGRHIPRALLSASSPEGWEFIEKLLLAAQREEGLRQVILETVDEANLQAFKRILRLILDHDLVRFAATARAIDVWFGLGWDSASTTKLSQSAARVLDILENESALEDALQNGDGEQVYFALWAVAFEDAYAAIPLAINLLNDGDVARRFAAIHLLAQLNLDQAQIALLPALQDEDLRVAVRAAESFYYYHRELPAGTDLFERIEQLLKRIPPKTESLKPIIWEWMAVRVPLESISGLLLTSLENRSPKRLLPYINSLNEYNRLKVAEKLAEGKKWDDETRDALFKLIGDRATHVREGVINLLKGYTVSAEEARYIEGLLTRKSDELRRGILSMLLRQKDKAALISAETLLNSKDAQQRLAGLELLRLLNETKRSEKQSQALATSFQEARSESLSGAEETALRGILQAEEKIATLQDGLGLFNPKDRTKPLNPRKLKVQLTTSAAIACLKSLDELIHEHRTEAITVKTWQGEQEVLLGDAHSLVYPDGKLPIPEQVSRFPLRDVWENWWENRENTLRDTDQFELLRGLAQFYLPQEGQYPNQTLGQTKLRLAYPQLVQSILVWLIVLHPHEHAINFLLDAVEAKFASISGDTLKAVLPKEDRYHHDWRSNYHSSTTALLQTLYNYRHWLPLAWTDEHQIRLWQLLRWLDEPLEGAIRHYPPLEEVLNAWRLGVATPADVYDQLLGERPTYYGRGDFHDLAALTRRKPHQFLQQFAGLSEIVNRCRDRVLDIELTRGDMPTAATAPSLHLSAVFGTGNLIRILQALSSSNIERGYHYNNLSRSVSLSNLLRVSFPNEQDTHESFAAAVKAAKIKSQRLIEAAVYAPQWAPYVEYTLEWEGFTEAVWWVYAHTKDSGWRVNNDIREIWQAQVNERTPLSPADLLEGAVDVAWFLRVYEQLGEHRWSMVYDAAKYSSGGIGHARARLFADAMLGQSDQETLKQRILIKRHQDSVRAIGLLPLPTKGKDEVVLQRYQILQEFLRGSRKFGSQRQQSEKTATRIGMENLARTAGYPDPIRLQWAMEAREIADLRKGPVIAETEGVRMALRIDTLGKPQLAIEKQGKPLKAIPAKLKKFPSFVELRERAHMITQQGSRMRLSLEESMCRGDLFTAKELRDLTTHPVLAPMLKSLVFIGDEGMGYLSPDGKQLVSHDGSESAIPARGKLRLAHADDLYRSGEWHLWQRECFVHERIQPFKQVFRELYPLTEAEKVEGTISRRYAGHQVQPKQAMALLGHRGWVVRPDEGVQRTFHKEQISVHLNFIGGYFTAADVDGLTLEGVVFTKIGNWKPTPLTDIPPIIFSEVMRDLDLVVSVAHRGGVDPETTASTVEMRSALIRETCALLKVQNVELQSRYAVVSGKLGNYTVHLGSGIVHIQPGGSLCIIPVHSQHRGRLFLPFADDDPKTAEIMSKVLLLARDSEIKDPTILEQIFTRN
ncbi:MAG: DUF5724 domain-containing protein [Anaerolineae bacterium]|nr:DUF5724 domain-containing protein [Anaerolineae bacterium]